MDESGILKLINGAKQEYLCDGGCNTYFYIEFYKIWTNKINNIIKRLRDANSIHWGRTQMSYHMFTNLGENKQGYLVSKLRKGLA